jgi:hypothetical protein
MLAQSATLGLILALAVGVSHATELEVPAPASGGAHLTVYTSDFALIRDRREIRLPTASADLAFTGVSRRMQPETALLEILNDEHLAISEQTFSFDVITPERLMEHSVGREVGVIMVNPASGEETIKRAKVLGVTNGTVLEMEGKIYTGAPGRIVFDQLPDGLRSTPTLLMAASGTPGRVANAELSYLTSGLSWRADYVARYDRDAGRIDLKAWATVTNTTGMDFKGANIKLVAGDVNRMAPQPPPRAMRAMEMQRDTASASMAKGGGAEGLVAYHMYSLTAATTLNDRESKQLALLDGPGVAVKRELVARSQPYFFTTSLRGQAQEGRAELQLAFKNNTAAKLGIPLPAGIVRVYTTDSDGTPQFLGEGGIDHTAVGGEVNLKLGTDFDVPVVREQTNFVRASDNITLSSWRVTIRNAKSSTVTVRVIEQLPGSWEITKETKTHKKLNAAEVEWPLQIPANGEAVLEYTVRTRF